MRENHKTVATKSLLVLYNAECKSGGVQKLSGAVFCIRATAEKLMVLYKINGELVSEIFLNSFTVTKCITWA